MSQGPATASQPAAQPAPSSATVTRTPPATLAPTTASLTKGSAQRDLKENVPALLNRIQAGAVAVCIVFGVLAALLQFLGWQANGRAAENTEQVVRIQQIQSSMLRADALATNAFLVGGLEPAEQRAQYEATIEEVLALLADAAEAQPADREALAALGAQINDYTGQITQARVNNRQGFPVGSAYLNAGGATLREGAQPVLDSLVDANTDRAVDEMDGQSPILLLLVGVGALGLLYLLNTLVAKRFHRRFNLGLVAAGVLVAGLTLIVTIGASSTNSDNEETREGSYRTAVNEAQARTAANDAKARESQGLINRGSGDVYEVFFDEAAMIVQDNASPRTLALWQQYLDRHNAIRASDDEEGNWDEAVRLATATDSGSATALLDEVDYNAQQVIEAEATDAADSFRSGGGIAIALMVLTLLGAVFAAGAATWGIGERRREYA